jgi:DNA modification methylase
VQTFKIGERNEQLCKTNPVANLHPTVKPIELMRWLVRLLAPPGGLVLDPFTGSGSTGAAVVLEGFRFLGIEREGDYIPIARARIGHWARAGQKTGR